MVSGGRHIEDDQWIDAKETTVNRLATPSRIKNLQHGTQLRINAFSQTFNNDTLAPLPFEFKVIDVSLCLDTAICDRVHTDRFRHVQRVVDKLVAMYQAGTIKPRVDSVWSFKDVDKALAKMHDRHNIGRVLLIAGEDEPEEVAQAEQTKDETEKAPTADSSTKQ